MHRCHTFPRRDGKASFEGYRRFGQGCVHAKSSDGLVSVRSSSSIVQEYDLRNTASLEESVRHSDVVYNLVGRDYPTKYGVF